MLFTLAYRINKEQVQGAEVSFKNATAAIDHSRDYLQGIMDFRPLDRARVTSATVGVALGQLSIEDVEWLGEWSWTLAEGWHWQARARQ